MEVLGSFSGLGEGEGRVRRGEPAAERGVDAIVRARGGGGREGREDVDGCGRRAREQARRRIAGRIMAHGRRVHDLDSIVEAGRSVGKNGKDAPAIIRAQWLF